MNYLTFQFGLGDRCPPPAMSAEWYTGERYVGGGGGAVGVASYLLAVLRLEPDGDDDASEDGDTEFMPLVPPMTARGSLMMCSSPEYMFQGRPGLRPPVGRVEETKSL